MTSSCVTKSTIDIWSANISDEFVVLDLDSFFFANHEFHSLVIGIQNVVSEIIMQRSRVWTVTHSRCNPDSLPRGCCFHLLPPNKPPCTYCPKLSLMPSNEHKTPKQENGRLKGGRDEAVMSLAGSAVRQPTVEGVGGTPEEWC